jgi:hypothetical protein
MSFSVPDTAKYKVLINWYETQDKQERSQNFRNIFMTYLGTPSHTIESKAQHHVSQPLEIPPIERINIEPEQLAEVDLNAKFNLIGMRG